jgi:hypothetical protein
MGKTTELFVDFDVSKTPTSSNAQSNRRPLPARMPCPPAPMVVGDTWATIPKSEKNS